MKLQTGASTPLKKLNVPAGPLSEYSLETAQASPRPSPQAAKRILISLMASSMMLPAANSVARVALPIIRDDFQLQADVTAWVAVAFTMSFMVLMPLYGRLSDGLGKRRLLLAGSFIFSIGTALTLLAPSLDWLIAGQVIQGLGVSGMMPLSMAMISTIFPVAEKGKALGTWSSVGPATAFLGPLVAGLLIAAWGWRAAFAPPLLVGFVALWVIYKGIPAGLSIIKPNFLRTFDWGGVALFAAAVINLVFYLSSRPITGVAPLQDWRLLLATLLLLTGFLWWEKRRPNPFVSLHIFSNKMFNRSSFCAAMRMFCMGGLSFLIPLYLVDVHGLSPAQIGGLLMINPGALALMVRFGGQMSDRWGSRWPVIIGLTIQASAMVIFSQLPDTISIWVLALALGYHGLGAGLVLAPLHQAALGNIAEAQMGAAAGLYSMLRFIGVVTGTALGGVILQHFLDLSFPAIKAYQNVFLFYAGFTCLGVIAGFGLSHRSEASNDQGLCQND